MSQQIRSRLHKAASFSWRVVRRHWREVQGIHRCANVERLEMRIHYGHAISRIELALKITI